MKKIKNTFRWIKRGRIGNISRRTALMASHLALPFADPIKKDRARVYFSSRDKKSRSRIFSFHINISPENFRVSSKAKLILDLGEPGAFDDCGVMPSWLFRVSRKVQYLYYTGWSLGRTVPFYFYIGLAVSRDGGKNFKRYSRAPVLGRSRFDPCLTA